jgi:uncharacterized cupredoxin-like copper-binding protein
VHRIAVATALVSLLAAGCAGAPEPDLEVGMTEMAIFTETTIPAGTTVWEVTNVGETHHNLTICPGTADACEGENVEQQVIRKPEEARDPDDLPDVTDALVLGAGWTALVEVDLEPGSYRLWCAVPNHAANGMQLGVDVVET